MYQSGGLSALAAQYWGKGDADTVERVRAAELLESSGLSVTEIAYGCGFSGSSYFIETFRKARG